MKKRGKIIGEFKEFALKGNVIDLAVGILVGSAFQGIVNSLVKDVITPFIGLIGGSLNFADRVFWMGSAKIAYGSFITAVINFLIMAFVIFLLVKGINKIKTLSLLGPKQVEEKAPTTKKCPFCISEISIEASRCPHCTSVLEAE